MRTMRCNVFLITEWKKHRRRQWHAYSIRFSPAKNNRQSILLSVRHPLWRYSLSLSLPFFTILSIMFDFSSRLKTEMTVSGVSSQRHACICISFDAILYIFSLVQTWMLCIHAMLDHGCRWARSDLWFSPGEKAKASSSVGLFFSFRTAVFFFIL